VNQVEAHPETKVSAVGGVAVGGTSQVILEIVHLQAWAVVPDPHPRPAISIGGVRRATLIWRRFILIKYKHDHQGRKGTSFFEIRCFISLT
jgi:hypothetical protein